MFVSATRNDVGDIKTVSHADNANHRGNGQHGEQTDDDHLQRQINVTHIIQTSLSSSKQCGDSVTVVVWHNGSALVSINVNLHCVRLVLRWVNTSRFGRGN